MCLWLSSIQTFRYKREKRQKPGITQGFYYVKMNWIILIVAGLCEVGFTKSLVIKISQIMKLKKRKIKYSAIFFLCWFTFLVILVDGIIKFQTLVDYFGSYTLTEITLLLLVILPTLAVYKFTKEK